MTPSSVQTKAAARQVLLNRGVSNAGPDRHSAGQAEDPEATAACWVNCSSSWDSVPITNRRRAGRGEWRPLCPITPRLCDPEVIEQLPHDFLEEHVVLPMFKVFGHPDPRRQRTGYVFVIDEIRRLTGPAFRSSAPPPAYPRHAPTYLPAPTSSSSTKSSTMRRWKTSQ
jgi:hypothetical protein